MPAPIIAEVPVTPWTLYPTIADIPAKGFKGVEVEAIAIEKDHGGKVYCTRLVFSPEDGPLKMCSVYLREEGGGVVCIADLPTKEDAIAYAAEVAAARRWPVNGSIWHLRIREVVGKGYVSDPRESAPFTLEPAKAALYHHTIAKADLFAGGPAEHGRWISFADAGNHAVDRAAEREALLSRVFDAAVGAMAGSAPAKCSSDAERMRDMLRAAVEANRADRLVVFDVEQRSVIEETLDEGRFELTGNESDEDLCDLILAAHPHDLFDNMDEDFEIGLLRAFASESAVVAIEGAIERSPLAAGRMLKSIHLRLDRQGIESPFARHFAQADIEAAPAPRC
ncbi:MULTISPECIES: hypothetical protein [unclassified Variovorax]|uniref:hypothetical protein n=1 Tax=unclassified Variovorax TaxID=663243 RepID=UPI00076C1949|nr:MULTISPECIES: hypothetical protein [unclassified Variovorax]KWT69524.1 hypothetical protein APY03_6884 [Variovorax sp. WDL1]PNG48839.1 hypothetical protein CHC06_06607 [Variovorax sp. B2]PNG49346.1 hypothetical protein CHC07_06255 [Variovorax sp. B4]VTV18361.1 hypothetical protein WDL1P2_00069 [Variovorax sp. WDL1]